MSDDSFERMKGFYRDGRAPVAKMSGEMPEMLRLAVRLGAWVGFTFAFNKKETWARVLAFNDFTGRVTVQGGGSSRDEQWVRSFGIKQVKMYTYSFALYEEWKKEKGRL